MLVNTHIPGVNAYRAPAIHLRQLDTGSLFQTYAESFEAVWIAARPVLALGAQRS